VTATDVCLAGSTDFSRAGVVKTEKDGCTAARSPGDLRDAE
jgi:hypothetical protein